MTSSDFQPAYLQLASGELQARATKAIARLAECTLCPRKCGAARQRGDTGECRTGRYARVSSYFAHHGEEACLRGRRGSGTIFFSGCNLHCVFCQNFELSWGREGKEVSPGELAEIMLGLQEQGCHNINLVTPSHVVAQILEALAAAVAQGLRLPLVFNTSAYDRVETLALLDRVVDVYMPDFKFWTSAAGARYAGAADYPEVAREAIAEMQRQVGYLVFDEEGIAIRGVLLRHLVMPGAGASTAAILAWIASFLGRETYVNLMAQYRPWGLVSDATFPEIARCLTASEYRNAVSAAQALGLRRGDRSFRDFSAVR